MITRKKVVKKTLLSLPLLSAIVLSTSFARAAEDKAHLLKEAVGREDSEAVVKILEEAGGAVQAKELAKAAKALPFSLGYRIGYSITVDGDKENLTLYKVGGQSVQPIGGIIQTRSKQ